VPRDGESSCLLGAVDAKTGLVMLVAPRCQPRLHVGDGGTSGPTDSDLGCERPNLTLELVLVIDKLLPAGSTSSRSHSWIVSVN